MKCIGQFFLSNIFQNSPELKYALKACSEVIYERKKTEFWIWLKLYFFRQKKTLCIETSPSKFAKNIQISII